MVCACSYLALSYHTLGRHMVCACSYLALSYHTLGRHMVCVCSYLATDDLVHFEPNHPHHQTASVPVNTCYIHFFILDSRRVLAPVPKVLGPKHISNPDFAPF